MNKTIVHISVSPLVKPLAEALHIETCQKLGYTVVYLDLSQSIGLDKNKHNTTYSEIIKELGSFNELEQFLSQFSPRKTLLNLQLFKSKEAIPLIIKTQSFGLKKTFFDIDNFPEPSWKKKLRSLKFNFFPFPIMPDFVFRTGGYSPFSFPRAVKIYPLNHPSYDLIIASDFLGKTNIGNKAVFIDQSLPSHPDFNLLGGNDISFENYYKTISSFLLKIQKMYGFEPIIAAHPKIDVDTSEIYGVKLIKGQTESLIRESSLVLMHSSYASSSAVILRKPILFITNNAILNSIQGPYVLSQTKKLSDSLGQQVINTDEIDNITIPEINKIKYDQYELNFLTTRGTKMFQSKDLIEKYLAEIFENLQVLS